MLLRSIVAVNTKGDVLTLPIEDPQEGILIKNIEGLDPVKATLVTSSFAAQDGSQYHSSRREPRQIRIRLGLDPNPLTESMYDLRTKLYNFFMPKSEVFLTFNLLNWLGDTEESRPDMDLTIGGRVESFETVLFSKEPEALISIICFDPDFVDVTPRTFNGLSTDALIEDTLIYKGTVNTGFTFKLSVNDHINAFGLSIHHRSPANKISTINYILELNAGDELTIITSHGEKNVIWKSGGVETFVLYGITPQSQWLELAPGENHFRVAIDGPAMPYTIKYMDKYGGL